MPHDLYLLEVAFDGATWEDLSDRLLEASTRTGKQRTLDTFQAATCALRLDNSDRQLDPANPDSRWHGLIVPLIPVRLHGRLEGQWVPIFTGYVQRWPPSWQVGYAEIRIQAVDAAGAVLANPNMPASVWEHEIRSDAPDHWWRLGESSGTTAVDVAGGIDGTYLEGATFNAREGLVDHDPDGAISFDYEQRHQVQIPAAGSIHGPGDMDLTLEFIIQAPRILEPAATGISRYVWDQFGPPVVESYVLQGELGSGRIGFFVTHGAFFAGAEADTVVADGRRHHVACVKDGIDYRIYIDGTDDTSFVATGNPPFGFAASPVGIGGQPYPVASTDTYWGGVIDEVLLYRGRALTPARIAAHAQAIRDPWAGDKSGERIHRILDVAGWPTEARDIDAGQSVMQPQTLGGAALQHLQLVERSELAALYIAAGGKVRFRERHAAYNKSVRWRFTDDHADDDALFASEVTFSYDAESIRNEARVQRTGGSVRVAADLDSQTRFLRRVEDRSGLLLADDQDVHDQAHHIVARHSQPALTVDEVLLRPSVYPELWPVVLDVQLEDRMLLTARPPSGHPGVDPIVLEADIVGVSHALTREQWECRLQLDRADPTSYIEFDVTGIDSAFAY